MRHQSPPHRLVLLPLFSLLAALFAMPLRTEAQEIPDNVTFRNHFGTMQFNRPLQLAPYPGEDSAYVVVQQNGRLITVRRVGDAWAKTDSASIPVLNGTSGGNEQGLLGFAFHPQFTANGKYYVHYITGSGNGVSLIAQRVAGANRRPLTTDAQTTILRMTQPFENHNGGSIGFGPDDKFYVAFGDGGSGGDPGNRAQDLDTLFGKILRLDVDAADAYPSDTTRNYGIPSDNPFVGQAGRRGEIWAYGLRNPFRWNFHPLTGHMWVGDVGQDVSREEISRIHTGGLNLGWPIREGSSCFRPATGCTSEGLTPPAATIVGHGRSVMGGAVFTGDETSAYHGVYIFGDYVSDRVWAMRPEGGTLLDSVVIGEVYNVASFDRDARGRVFATSLSNSSGVESNNGAVFILESPDMVASSTSLSRDGRDGFSPLRLSDVRRNPAAYEWRGLDGRIITTPTTSFRGTAWVRAKGSREPARLMTVVW